MLKTAPLVDCTIFHSNLDWTPTQHLSSNAYLCTVTRTQLEIAAQGDGGLGGIDQRLTPINNSFVLL